MSEQSCNYSAPEPPPIANENGSIHDLVIADIQDRKEFGLQKYGTLLQAGNGRQPLKDAYQELLDFVLYFRQYLEEENLLKEPPSSPGINCDWQGSDIL